MLLLADDSQFIYESISAGGAITIGYRLWVPASLFAFMAGLAFFGWSIRKKTFLRLAPFIGFVGLAIMLPSIFFLDTSTVDESGMTLRTGFWSQIEHHFPFDAIEAVHLTESTYENRDGVVEYHECMYCDITNGRTSEMRVSDRLDRTAFKYFVAEIHKRKIPVVNHRIGDRR